MSRWCPPQSESGISLSGRAASFVTFPFPISSQSCVFFSCLVLLLLSVLSFFCYNGPFSWCCFSRKLKYFSSFRQTFHWICKWFLLSQPLGRDGSAGSWYGWYHCSLLTRLWYLSSCIYITFKILYCLCPFPFLFFFSFLIVFFYNLAVSIN